MSRLDQRNAKNCVPFNATVLALQLKQDLIRPQVTALYTDNRQGFIEYVGKIYLDVLENTGKIWREFYRSAAPEGGEPQLR
ncbi:MAG TPA: hypothetical protein VE397_12910 [Stellaceae bacterium]|nr:hypothetical protein [Stellaceae bacterium]